MWISRVPNAGLIINLQIPSLDLQPTNMIVHYAKYFITLQSISFTLRAAFYKYE